MRLTKQSAFAVAGIRPFARVVGQFQRSVHGPGATGGRPNPKATQLRTVASEVSRYFAGRDSFGSTGPSGNARSSFTSHACYSPDMAEVITQRELRNDSGEIMRRLDQGEAFVVTRNGVPVGELIPVRRRRFVPRDNVLVAFAHAPAIDAARFRDDLDRHVAQHIEPRA
jgi:prevent-host-death family protein